MRKSFTLITGLLTVGLLAVPLAGCTADKAAPEPTAITGEGYPVAPGAPTPAAELIDVAGVGTAVTFDTAFTDALTTLGVTPGVTGTAELTDGVLTLPITGGDLNYYDPKADYRPYLQGELDHSGSGLTLTVGETVVNVVDLVLDPGTAMVYGTITVNGEPIGPDLSLFRFDESTLVPLTIDEAGNAVLSGATLYLSEDASTMLNATFGTDVLNSDLKVGVANITATATTFGFDPAIIEGLPEE